MAKTETYFRQNLEFTSTTKFLVPFYLSLSLTKDHFKFLFYFNFDIFEPVADYYLNKKRHVKKRENCIQELFINFITTQLILHL